MKPDVRVYANNDEAIIAWRYAAAIPGCIGFALFRRRNDESADAAEPIMNRVGFADESYTAGQQQPTTQWPIQRFLWTDHQVKKGDTVSYKIFPMIERENELVKDETDASDWTEPVQIGTGTTYQAFFNRGIVSSQFYSRMSRDYPGESVRDIVTGPDTRLRRFLGGYLADELFTLLDGLAADPTVTVYAVLYELSQSDLLAKLIALGERVQVILANGAAKDDHDDKNAAARAALRAAGVTVYDRMVAISQRHFAHNKYLVICRNGSPQQVWTGSTNWTPSGLFSQVNNGLLVSDAALAADYLNEWRQLQQAGSGYPPTLARFNASAMSVSDNLRVWFAPTPARGDLQDAAALLQQAGQGILFLMFNPGPRDTLFNTILNVQQARPDLFIHGILNQDPGGKNPLIFFHRGEKIPSNWSAILPKKVDSAFSFWTKEVSGGLVTIHSKVVVIDPFSDSPWVLTGSHNMGPKASQFNDDNLLFVRDRKLAQEYAVNVMAVYDHYRWRYSLFNKNTDYKGLTRDPGWMAQYMTSLRMKEVAFWLG